MEVAKQDDQETMVRVRKERSTSTSAIIIDYDKFMEMYNIDFRRGEITSGEAYQNQQDSSRFAPPADTNGPGSGICARNHPIDETDAGKKGGTPF